MKAKLFLLLLGLLAGVAAAVFFPTLRDRLLPAGLRSAATEGAIAEKRLEEDRLLLTLVTEDGAVLATFTERLSEIDLLVAAGDTVGLSLDGYRPFVDNPEIVRVRKATGEPDSPPAPTRPAVGSSADFTLYRDLPELSPDPDFCPSVSLCVFEEEVLVKAQCAGGQIASVSRSIDHYFEYLDGEACAACRLFLQNDGLEIRQGPQGYCRFDEYDRLSDVPEIETAVCVRDPDELSSYCLRDGTLLLDRWVHRSEILPCNTYGPVSGFPAESVSCSPLRGALGGDAGAG